MIRKFGIGLSVNKPAISSMGGAVPSGPKPVFVSAVIENAVPANLVITMDMALKESSVPDGSAFTVSGKTVSTVAISGTSITLTVSTAFGTGQVVTVAYTKPALNPIQALAGGGKTDSFSAQSVTNNVAYDAASTDLFARMLTADSVAQTDARKLAIDTCIKSLKAADLFENQWDVLVVMRGTGELGVRQNWIKNAHHPTPLSGTTTYTNNVGVKRGAGNGLMNSNYKPSTQGVKYTKDDAAWLMKLTGVYGTTVGHGVVGSGNCWFSSNGNSFYINSLTADVMSAYAGDGYKCIVRNSATQQGFMRNTDAIQLFTRNSSAKPDYNLYLFVQNNWGTPSGSTGVDEIIELYAAGRKISQANFAIFQTIMNTYFASL